MHSMDEILGYKPDDDAYRQFIQALEDKVEIASGSLARAGKKVKSIRFPRWGVANDIDAWWHSSISIMTGRQARHEG
ncbi:hypothetical protein BDZ89DRAFT_1080668 [Hymenopellis radicata]|nr:hypothetical protein BDZ89DRAFT_1080668 [Hymenopellis radicata]